MLCGFTVSEYIRNRRLAEAGMELLSSNEKIIDIALMYGYDSHDSFTKAFSRFHGVTPSAVRRGGCTLKAFAPLRLQFILGGGYSVKEMSRAGPKKGAQNQPCQPRSFQGMSEKEEKFKQNQVQ